MKIKWRCECGAEMELAPRAAARQKLCKECNRLKHVEVVKAAYRAKKKQEKNSKKLCSCGCGRPVGEGLRFLSDYCYRNKNNDEDEEWRVGR